MRSFQHPLLEAIILGSVFTLGYRSWQQQKEIYNKRILVEQQQATHNQKNNGSKPISRNQRRTREDWISMLIALILSTGGRLSFPLLGYLSVPFLLYSLRNRFITGCSLLLKVKMGTDLFSLFLRHNLPSDHSPVRCVPRTMILLVQTNGCAAQGAPYSTNKLNSRKFSVFWKTTFTICLKLR